MKIKNRREYRIHDLEGQVFGDLTVLGEYKYSSNEVVLWKCLCRCGNTKYIRASSLREGRSKSCGCRHKNPMPRPVIFAGKRFGRLVVLSDFEKKGPRGYLRKVKCDCGNIIWCPLSNLVSGNTKSCGCLKEDFIENATEHGMWNTRFYRIWLGMKARCLNPNNNAYDNYGGRGITVCNRWLDFKNFMKDTHSSYLKHVEEFGEEDTSINRPDVNGHYDPSNYEWATFKEQQNDRRDSIKTKNKKFYYFITNSMRLVVNKILFENKRLNSKYLKYIGCSPKELRDYIESQFTDGMTWENHGRYYKNSLSKLFWQIDHIQSLYTFDLTQEKDRLEAFNYKNLRPMWHEDNIKTKFR